MKASRILLSALALAAGTAYAGTAEVRFVDPADMTDLATNKGDERETIQALTRHVERLAQALPSDQLLRVDVLDVDLAGRSIPSARRGDRIRIVRNGADSPSIHLRWTLQARGQVLRTGEDRLTQLDYLHHGLASDRTSTPLYDEKKLLDEWFSREFAQKQADAR